MAHRVEGNGQKVILPSPGKYDHSIHVIPKNSCGWLAVALAFTAYDNFIPGMLVKKREAPYHFCGAMLPWHMKASFDLLFTKGSKLTEEAGLSRITDAIDRKCPAIVFLGCDAGHWVTVWGYDKDNFYMYDNRDGLERDEDDLVTMNKGEFDQLWGRIPKRLKAVQWLGKFLSHLRVKPFTMITPF